MYYSHAMQYFYLVILLLKGFLANLNITNFHPFEVVYRFCKPQVDKNANNYLFSLRPQFSILYSQNQCHST